MKAIDVIILIIVFIIFISILYFHIIKNRKKPCRGCPYAKRCDKHCE